jgi:hypothetical protein
MAVGAERLNSTQVVAFTPPHTAGPVDITVTIGGSPVTLTGAYTYTTGVSGTTFFQSSGLTAARGDRPAAAYLPGTNQVLVTGGTSTSGSFATTLSSTDVTTLTPGGSIGAFSAGPAMLVPRALHSATTLPDGRILIVGGASTGNSATNTTEIINAAGTAPAAGPTLSAARLEHTATLLDDGRVLIAGGASSVGGTALNTAEIFDPLSNTFGAPITMVAARLGHTATPLPSGQVLITGLAPGSGDF